MLLSVLVQGEEALECNKKGERKKGWGDEEAEGAEEAGGAGGEERTYNFWTQSSRSLTQNFVHPNKKSTKNNKQQTIKWRATI